MAEMPDDPIGGLAEAAVSLHELYVSCMAAGFTEAQSFVLTNTALTAMLGKL